MLARVMSAESQSFGKPDYETTTSYEERKAELSSLLERVEQDLRRDLALYQTVLDLFKEAAECYCHGLNLSTCVMCRATLEAALHVWRHHKIEIKKGRSWSHSWRVPEKMPGLSRLLRDASNFLNPRRILDDRHKRLAEDIKNMGDIASHLEQRKDKSADEAFTSDTAEYRDRIAPEEAEETLRNLGKFLLYTSPRIREQIVKYG